MAGWLSGYMALSEKPEELVHGLDWEALQPSP